jgi:hypothetical protein
MADLGTGGMFGAPAGISAAQDQMNQNLMTQVGAEEKLMKIAEGPAVIMQKLSEARHQQAQAMTAEQKAADAARTDGIVKSFAALGKIATVNDVKPPVDQTNPDDYYARLLKYGQENDMPFEAQEKLATLVANQKEKGAIGAYRNSQAVQEDLKSKKSRAEAIANYAQQALDNPEQYAQIRMLAANEGLPVDQLPQAFNADLMTRLRDRGLSLQKAADAAEREAEHKRQEAARSADAAARAAAKVKADREKADAAARERATRKTGGTGTAASDEAKAAAAERARVATQKDLDLYYPVAPAEPKARKVGKIYRNSQNQFGIWLGEGKWQAVPQPRKGVSPPAGEDE